MDNLLGLIAIAVIYLCVVLRSDKKRRAGKKGGGEEKAASRRSGGRRRTERRASFAQAFDSDAHARGADTASGAAPASAAREVRTPGVLAAKAADTAFPEEDCTPHAPGLHLHAVTQERMRSAGEGEDPCHAGGAPRPAPEHEPIPDMAGPAADSAAARELLRGVILSEILERPCERHARLQNRRRM